MQEDIYNKLPSGGSGDPENLGEDEKLRDWQFRVEDIIGRIENIERSNRDRIEFSKWTIGIVLTAVAIGGFAAGRMTSHWMDLNAELRQVRERIAVVETEARLADPRPDASGKSVVGAGTEAE